ncbi:hypothetical protein SAMN04489761_0953 [Tenacibaculum sp. MAR_2009_124]|uniref:gliding motility protein GldB-related protein n=1 Tax=Tenacibaculum sp. MAR_2009_124 TaxID=1250059 RepID=UPI000894C4F3|nr:hypothetical protein [Tenacibaculum sp. MAR_2009_124]SEB47899.1 hypothetical protein SAMN04489761_0953 [Tenacibaculum sp. MAR_2009_124]
MILKLKNSFNHIIKLLFILLIVMISGCQKRGNIITSDIDNFWNAYDNITATKDSTLQYKYLDSLYFKKGTEGLKAIRFVRNYKATDYINSINNYPLFWSSIRKNTLKANQLSSDLEEGIQKLKNIYPDLKPAKIFFIIGAFRTSGTTLDSLVLIGSEFAMTDKNTVSTEFPEEIQSARRKYFNSNPINDLVLLNVHEYVHTQQKAMVHNILSLAIYEGVAEFVSVKAMGGVSAVPAIAYGKKNMKKVLKKFEEEMFYSVNENKWLWGEARLNEFNVRDLGYYVGYQMCENFYNSSKNKKVAIQQLIELDFNNEKDIESFVDGTDVFSDTLEKLYENFERKRPKVTRINQFENHSVNVNPAITEITIEFSEPLNGYHTGVDFGKLGKQAFPEGTLVGRKWGSENESWTIPVKLKPERHYQILISNNFRMATGIPLKPFLIDFKTSKN